MTGELQYNASDANIYYTNTTASSSANVGQLILGTSTPGTVAVLTVNANVTPIASMPQVAPVGTIVQLCAEDGQGVQFCMDSFGSLSSFVGRSASGTAASPTALSSNRGICRVIAEGWDGTSYYRAAQINFGTAEAFTSSNGGSQIVSKQRRQEHIPFKSVFFVQQTVVLASVRTTAGLTPVTVSY